MKTIFLLALFALLSTTFAFAAPLECANTATALSARTQLFQAVDRAAAEHATFGSRTAAKASDIFSAFTMQRCANADHSTRAVTVDYKVLAKGPRSAAKTFVCQTKLKRHRNSSGRLGAWRHVDTQCRLAQQSSSAPSNGSSDDSSSNDRGTPGPDDVYDADFGHRTPSYGGPDDTSDGDSWNSGDSDSRGYYDDGGYDEWH